MSTQPELHPQVNLWCPICKAWFLVPERHHPPHEQGAAVAIVDAELAEKDATITALRAEVERLQELLARAEVAWEDRLSNAEDIQEALRHTHE